MYVIQVLKSSGWTDFTSTANRERIELFMSLARITNRGRAIRWIRR